VITLARETGWSEDFIMRRAPLARLLRYYHAAAWSNGAWTRKVATEEQRQGVDAVLALIPQQTEECDE